MSNVTTLQSNYNIITNNNLTIDDILETINNLPEAGSGEEDLTTVLESHDTAITTQETTIDSIITALEGKASGITPTGELAITSNGTYDVTNYASANVEVPNSGGELQYVTGTITRDTINDITSGTTFFSVSGLGFAPKFVYIGWAVLSGSMAYTSNRKDSYWFVGAMGGLKTMDIEVRRSASAYAYLYSNNGSHPKATVNLNNDGFEVVANDKIVLYTGEYQYIAIG